LRVALVALLSHRVGAGQAPTTLQPMRFLSSSFSGTFVAMPLAQICWSWIQLFSYSLTSPSFVIPFWTRSRMITV